MNGSGTRPREREKTDTKVNTEWSAVVNHIAKLNGSGDVKEMTDREKTPRLRLQDHKKKLSIPSESEFRRAHQSLHRMSVT